MPPRHSNTPLPKGFRLDRYTVDHQISSGGFSIVYLAHDDAGAPFAIKEYFPQRAVTRASDSADAIVAPEHQSVFNQGMNAFFEEGRLLAHLNHPNVVRVLNFFRANKTAYLVMPYEIGHGLHEHIHGLEQAGDTMGEDFLRHVFVRLLAGLREVHTQKLLHLDIKPANIFLRDDGQPLLLDFGATRVGLGKASAILQDIHTPDYAAPEQEGSGEPLGPWTDIYAVGASLYSCLSLRAPMGAKRRMNGETLELAEERWHGKYSAQLLELIDWCMKLPVAERPQSVFALQKVLNGELLDLVDPRWFEKP